MALDDIVQLSSQATEVGERHRVMLACLPPG
jgi:hypothetical protein